MLKLGGHERVEKEPEIGVAADSSSADRQRTPTLIEATDLAKSYGSVQAVQQLSFQVARGEILGLLGPNGAGKSTTLRILIGFQLPDSGEVLLNGHNVFRAGDLARRDLGYVPESLPLYGEMDVKSYLTYFARLKGVTAVRPAIERVVDHLDLAAVFRRLCGNLSRGYRQRVGLAQALLSDPSVLILDEPTSGLDPNQIHDFRGLIRNLGKDRAILLSTHILPEAIDVCDRVLIISKGKSVATGSPRDLAAGGGSLHWARIRTKESIPVSDAERFGLRAESERGAYRIEKKLDREESRVFLRTVADRDWELLEWQTGSAGLEAVFRRLTLGEEVGDATSPRAEGDTE